jgi:hypothetical protein
MDDQNNTYNSWQPESSPVPEQPVPDHYTSYDHQIPEHGSPDPMSPYQPPTPQPVFTPQPVMHTPVFPAPTTPQPSTNSVLSSNDDRPVPVVRVLSVRGIEYAMMTIMLFFWSGSLIIILVSLIMGGADFAALAFPVALLIIGFPTFSFFYIRLRRAELRDPSLRLEASKRRFSQITQIVAFLTCFFNLVALVFILISAAAGNPTTSIGKFFGATAVILLIAGGILAYYWIDEHKLVSKR